MKNAPNKPSPGERVTERKRGRVWDDVRQQLGKSLESCENR